MRLNTYVALDGGWKNLHSGATEGTPSDTVYAGALPLGSAKYAIPATGVVYLSPNGSDGNSGLTTDAPKGTLQAAVAACPTGGTVVVRGGVYEQAYSGSQSKPITIQNYYSAALGAAEEVWFDGSRQQSAWTANGDGTWTAPLFAEFDHSMPGGFNGGIDPAWPMAVWPDMVHVNGVRLAHRPNGTYSYAPKASQPTVLVTPPAEVPGVGEFTLDYTAGTVTIGTNPTGKEVRLSALGRWMIIRANMTIRGIGVRRFATTLLYSAATIDVGAPNVNLENVVIEDCGQQSIAFRTTCTSGGMSECTVRGASLVGVLGDAADNITFARLLVEGNNVNRWKNEPGAGGIKFGRFTNSTVRECVIRGNLSAGLWCDVSCYNIVVFNNVLHGNRGPAIEYEISRKCLIVNNWITGAGSSTVWGLDAGELRLWNNMLDRGESFDIRYEEDNRAGIENIADHPENPDGVQDWRTDQGEVCNNVLSNHSNRTGVWRLYSTNIAINESTVPYFSRIGGNVWSSTVDGSTSRMVTTKAATGGDVIHSTVAQLNTGPLSAKVGANLIAAFTIPTQTQMDGWASIGEPVPADVAALLGIAAGTEVVGPVVAAPVPR